MKLIKTAHREVKPMKGTAKSNLAPTTYTKPQKTRWNIIRITQALLGIHEKHLGQEKPKLNLPYFCRFWLSARVEPA